MFSNKKTDKKPKKDRRQFLADSTVRPYWHVDAKWIFGILFALFLCLSVFFFSLYKVTNKANAINIMSYVIANGFSINGLDDTSEIDDLKDMIKNSENGYVMPLPDLNIKVRAEDVEGKTPREIRMMIFSALAEPIYEGGEAIEGITNNPDLAKNIEENLGLLSFLSSSTHNFFYNLSLVFSFFALVFLAPLIYFSYQFGRLVSPGIIVVFVALPNALFWGLVNLVTRNINIVRIPFIEGEGSKDLTTSVNDIILQTLPNASQSILRTYLILGSIGLGLLLIALIGKMIVTVRAKEQS